MACLSEADMKCMDLDLKIRPDKCVSFLFSGSKSDKLFQVPLKNGFTINICINDTKCLGSLIDELTNLHHLLHPHPYHQNSNQH